LKFNGGDSDSFVAKINPTGSSLIYCGYIGGEGCEFSGGIAVDDTGNAYIFGQTSSDESSFPVTVGPDLTFNSAIASCDANSLDDCYVAKINIEGTALIYCGYIGGDNIDEAFAGNIAIDSTGSAYVAGRTNSNESSFPVAVGPDLSYNNSDDIFVAKVNASGAMLDYCGYIGGSGREGEIGSLIAVDNSGNAYICGDTSSPQSSFPRAVGPDLIKNGRRVVFVARVNASGAALDYCGYIENNDGLGTSAPGGIAVDSAGSAYVFGDTTGDETSFPVLLGPDLKYNGGDFDTFVAKINQAGTALIYCGYIGGGHDDFGEGGGIAVDESGNAYVVGTTNSKEGSFPVSVGPDLELDEGNDAFVAKIAMEQGFSLKQDRRMISIERGKSTDIRIHISRDPDFNESVTVTPEFVDENGMKLTPGERIVTIDNDIKFKLKIKSRAERSTRRLLFTGKSASGIEHTSAVTITITR
jgi:hypothetical protein